ncbi:MAG TPA: ABC transporter permease [Candidatus Saccharimonadales bacterium]|nr:ABC transporter permease [Candidatus Saccharimonadales bacterium]
MFQKFHTRYHYSLVLLRELVITDFKLRYQGSFLGYLWSLLRPLAIFLILYLIFGQFFGKGIPHYAIYLLLGIVVWNYFAEVTNGGVGAIVGKGDLLRKLNFPKYVIVLAGSLSALINLAINVVVVIIFMLMSHTPMLKTGLLAPLLIFELFMFALALAFFLSAAFVRLRDINYIWEVIMQAAFYATPIIYPVTLLPHKVLKVLMLNPVAQMAQDMRYLVLSHDTPTIASIYGHAWVRIIPLSIVVLCTIIAAWYFRKRSRYFAEEI